MTPITPDDLAILADLQAELAAGLPEEPDQLALRRIQALAVVRAWAMEAM